jgi:2-polyprenyl-3-methyl-5-hydroxy-6-metoxy-1,4-benzoquinol methylase
MVCVSHIDEFLLPHLANKYVGKMGVPEPLFRRQIGALHSIHDGRLPSSSLLQNKDNCDRLGRSKSYYEPSRPEIMKLIPRHARTVLSYGCGWGALEKEIAARGVRVTAVPLDSVIGACADEQGIEVIHGDMEVVVRSLSGRQFDAILVSNMLHLVPEPVYLLAWLGRLLAKDGTVVAAIPNLAYLGAAWRRLKRDRQLNGQVTFATAGAHRTSYRRIKNWFKSAKLKITNVTPIIPDRAQSLRQVTGNLTVGWLASEFLVVASKQSSTYSSEAAGGGLNRAVAESANELVQVAPEPR